MDAVKAKAAEYQKAAAAAKADAAAKKAADKAKNEEEKSFALDLIIDHLYNNK